MIGNLVHNPAQGINFVVDGSLIATEHSREKSYESHKGFEGVTITDERLIKLGFEKIKNGLNGEYFYKEIKIYLIENKILFYVSDSVFVSFDYIHQIQNLFNSLNTPLLK